MIVLDISLLTKMEENIKIQKEWFYEKWFDFLLLQMRAFTDKGIATTIAIFVWMNMNRQHAAWPHNK